MSKDIVKLSGLLPVMKVYYDTNKDASATAIEFRLSVETVTRYYRKLKSKHPKVYAEFEEKLNVRLTNDNEDFLETNVRYKKQQQKAQDLNRVERKTFREHARIENSVEEYGKEISILLKKHAQELKKITIKHPIKDKDKNVGIIQLSDLHLNELVNLPNNKFDFEIASKRLKKFANECRSYFLHKNIKTIMICFTGDLLNSDRRLDEILNQSTNRAKASILGVHLLKQFIVDLNKNFNVKVTGVVGNEGRKKDEMSWSNAGLSDSYDYTMLANLKLMFEDCKGIEFGNVGDVEQVIEVAGKHILLLHGIKYKVNPDGDVIKSKSRFINKNIFINYVLFGHIHQAMISDEFARSGSLVGSNAYNENSLNVSSTASQNCFIINENSIVGLRIDLQNVDGIEGYNIINELKASEAKSVDKANEMLTTIFKVVT